MEHIRWITAFLFLGVDSIRDIRTKTIFTRITILAAIAGIIYCLMDSSYPVMECVGGILLGVAVCFLAFMTREAIGYGDGLVMLGLGALIGGKNCFASSMAALIMSGMFAGFLLLFRRAKKQDQIAFVPFLFLGTVTVKVVIGI